MAELTREEFVAHIDLVRADLGEVKEHMIRMNGRVGAAETQIAVLTDRGHPAAWSGGFSGVLLGVVESIRWVLSR